MSKPSKPLPPLNVDKLIDEAHTKQVQWNRLRKSEMQPRSRRKVRLPRIGSSIYIQHNPNSVTSPKDLKIPRNSKVTVVGFSDLYIKVVYKGPASSAEVVGEKVPKIARSTSRYYWTMKPESDDFPYI